MPKTRPSTGTRDLAKIGAGAAMGALGVEGARKLLESRPEGPGGRPERPERPVRPEQPIARPPERPSRPELPIARPPEKPGRPELPIARPPERPGRPERPGKPERPERPIARPPERPERPPGPGHPPVARPPYRPGGPYRPGYPGYGPYYPIRPHWWTHATWGAAAGWIAGATFGAPRYYDYGTDIYYDNGSVYMDGAPVATAEEYYDQASQLAESAPPPAQIQEKPEADWLPLGVFALSREDNTQTNMVLQLAVSKEGVIQGTYYNTSTETERPIKGMVDKKTQRAAWTFADGKNTDIIMETGLYNLTKDDTQALVHFGDNKTQRWWLVRLQEPESKTQAMDSRKP